MKIFEVTEVTDDVVAAFDRLVPQLSKSNPPPTRAELEDLVASEASHLLLAEEDGTVYGCLTLVLFRIPTGIRAWIEDVIVDTEARGKGVGALLSEHAIEMSKAAGAVTVDLTSRPSREAANRLYARIGFEQRNTNVYRFDLGGD